ncbi:hypothetical protein BH10BAC3_BH10BAC3_14580 [soil metagenome]
MKRTLAFAIAAQAVSIVVLLILAYQFFKQLNTLSEYTTKVEHTYQVINQLNVVQSLIKDAETSSRGFLLTNNPQFLKLLHHSEQRILPAVDSLRSLINNNPVQLQLLKNVQTITYSKISMAIENARLSKRISNDSLLERLDVGRILMEQLEINMNVMRANELKSLTAHNDSKKKYEALLPQKVRILFLLTGLLTLLFGLWIFIELKKRFRYQKLLQNKFMELRQSNEELEQIAFAASHDLQEPLRKIRIFSDRLLMKTKALPEEENYLVTKRINIAAARLQALIGDIVTFNSLVQNKFSNNNVSIKEILNQSIATGKQKFPALEVYMENSDLPVIKGSEEQVLILFQHLINNAIEFRSPERPLKINIEKSIVKWSEIKGLPSEMTTGSFCHLEIIDNGIGFDETYKDKMFKPFQRLHNYETETTGRRKGMGLAMCKRVMLNLGGWIDANGIVGNGATIHLYFPVT